MGEISKRVWRLSVSQGRGEGAYKRPRERNGLGRRKDCLGRTGKPTGAGGGGRIQAQVAGELGGAGGKRTSAGRRLTRSLWGRLGAELGSREGSVV